MRWRLVWFERWADPIAEEILGARPEIELVRLRLSDPPEVVWKALESAHGYQWPRPPYLGDAGLIRRCPNLLAMASQGSGCDVMSFPACNEAGVLIVNQAGLGGREAVASHAFGMMIALSKQLVQCDRAMRRDRNWDRLQFVGEDLRGKTVGIVGIGNIGSRLAEMCRDLFAMRVLAYDPYLNEATTAARGARKVGFDEVFRESDFVSVHCPLTDETRGMVDARAFSLMRPGAYYVVTARGGITDEAALVAALRERRIAGAGVDVFDEEPPPLDHPLLGFDNVVVSCHIAGVTRQGYRSTAEAAALQWITIFEGKRPPRLVNPEVWPRYRERFARIAGRLPVEQ